MAAVTQVAAFSNTTDAATYTAPSAGTFTPTANDLLILIAARTAEASSDWTVTDSLGGSWTQITSAWKAGTTDIMEIWIRDTLAPASAMSVTYSHTGANATGCFLRVLAASGMSRAGASAKRSSGGQVNQGAGGTPAPALNQSALTENPTISAVFNATNPSGVTVPTNWTRFASDAGFASPTTGFGAVRRNSGFTGTTITWGSTSASAFCSVAVELDTSVPRHRRAVFGFRSRRRR